MKELDTRYIIIKYSDANACLTEDERISLSNLLFKIGDHRQKRSQTYVVEGVVIERDWPEYNPTVKLLTDRINK